MSGASDVFRVIEPGLTTTVQDAGRVGWQRFGVPVSGALDRVALAAANVVVGNDPKEAGLECLYQGCVLEVAVRSARVAAAGAGCSLEVTDASGQVLSRAAGLTSVTLQGGQRVRLKMAGPSISGYLAVEGGLAIPVVMGSRSTYVRAGFGGHEGRTLRSGDGLPLGSLAAKQRADMRLPNVALGVPTSVRVIAGPQDDHFTAEALARFLAETYTVRPASDRMGLRLAGAKLQHLKGADIVSDGIAPGAIQVPGDGLPIVMLADRQTTGGYTKIATVISADLPGLGRVGPGAQLRFELVDVAVAEAAARALAVEIAGWSGRLVPASLDELSLEMLHGANLISGVTDGV